MRTLTIKILTITAISLILMLPISMINSKIEERQAFKKSALNNISESSSEAQTITGPIVVVPYVKKSRKTYFNKDGDQQTSHAYTDGQLYFSPDDLSIESTLWTEERHRGIYSARLYHSDTIISAKFVIPANFGIKEDLDDYQFKTALVSFGISDVRGIESLPALTVNNESLPIVPGSHLPQLSEGVHAILPLSRENIPQTMDMLMPLKLQGTSSLSVSPTGRETRVSMTSDWPHPSFQGQLLPRTSEIFPDGFSANWVTSYLSNSYQDTFDECFIQKACEAFQTNLLSVSFIEPVDEYVKTERATKYAILFIVLIFTGFFLFEVLKKIQIHPVQYVLVGLALAVFYLLLLSLSEHFGFAFSYLIASLSSTLLISSYLSSLIASWKGIISFTTVITILYGMLYGIISAEDYALLMGSMLLFMMLSVFMILTRRIDWYEMGAAMSVKQTQSEPFLNRSKESMES